METREEFDITIDSSFMATFQSMPMEMFKVFREFIDNALQSYLDHKDKLDSIQGSPKKCVVNIEWDKNEIVIKDNAWGMDREAFARALKLNKRSDRAGEENRLSRFGMGLKTAACYASRDYIIESSEYGSGKRFKTEMDIDYIEKYAPETNTTIISDCLTSEHGTKIHLKRINPNCFPTTKTEKNVRKKLERIYKFYISDGLLEVSINGETIVSEDPVLLTNPTTGSESMCNFGNEDGFEFQGKHYRYQGWIGIVKMGDSSGDSTGFNYYQAKRCIVFSDHPDSLFGKANDARFQHVIGEIELLGNEWPITTNKDQILWGDQGLKEQFIADLLKERDIKALFDLAKKHKFRSRTPVVTNPPSSHNGNENQSAGSQNAAESQNESTVSPVTIDSPLPQPVSTTVQKRMSYKDKDYVFDIKFFDGDPDRDWVKLKSGPTADNETISIELNTSAPYLEEFMASAQCQKLLCAFAQAFALARLESAKSGLQLNDSFALENAINDIMRKAK